jgi:phosphopantetheinyl transferase
MSIQTLSQIQTEQTQTEQIASWLLKRLQEQQNPISFQELETHFVAQKGLSNRVFKETTWKLVEEGKIKFTSSWNLEIC